MSDDPQRERRIEGSFELGLGGIFKQLGDMISMLAELSETQTRPEASPPSASPPNASRSSIPPNTGLRGVYGISVRTNLNGIPQVQRFGNLQPSRPGTGTGPTVAPVREPLVDVFDEGDEIVVIAEMPGVAEHDVRVELHGDVLALETSGERRYARELLLPAPVEPESLRQTYRNGILELRMKRQAPTDG